MHKNRLVNVNVIVITCTQCTEYSTWRKSLNQYLKCKNLSIRLKWH